MNYNVVWQHVGNVGQTGIAAAFQCAWHAQSPIGRWAWFRRVADHALRGLRACHDQGAWHVAAQTLLKVRVIWPCALWINLLIALHELMLPGLAYAQHVPSAQSYTSPDQGATSMFGIPAQGSRIVYVVDISGSTAGAPLKAARRELLASLDQLERLHQFQVIFYNHAPRVLNVEVAAARLFWADDANKRAARRYVNAVSASGGTNHFDALRLALRMEPSTVFLYTDADVPQLTDDDLQKLRRLNGSSVIHAIEFGAGERADGEGGENFLMRLARENAGEYRYINVHRWAK